MKFSLIVSTKNRTDEIVRLFEGFRSQTFQDFEIIVSDQNTDNRVADILEAIQDDWAGRLTHLRSSGGLSAARNLGLTIAKGEIVTFPDDDCVYPPQLLENVTAFFDKQPDYGYLMGRSIFDDGKDASSRHMKEASPIRRFSIYKQCVEFAFFIRRSGLGDLKFDENLGVGSRTPWQADEGPDMMLNLETRGVRGYYDPGFAVWHPRKIVDYDQATIDCCYRYACGSGYFLRKHNYPLWFFLYLNLKTLCGVLIGWLTGKPGQSAFYWARLRGRWLGWNGFGKAAVEFRKQSAVLT